MALELDKKQLEELLIGFYNLTGFRVGLFDQDEKEVLIYPTEFRPFCAALRQNEYADRMCRASDHHAFCTAKKTGAFTLYDCGFGLVEAISPIKENDTVIGYMMIGQMIENSPEAINTIKSNCEQYFKEPAAINSLLSEMPVMDAKKIEAGAYIFQICTEYLRLAKKIKVQKTHTAEQLREYLFWNFRKEITVDEVCRQFGLCRTSLFLLMKQEFGKSLQSYIQYLRIEESKRLLVDSALQIKEIADLCGFRDPNYFARLFKTTTGMTPMIYRNRHEV